MAKCSPLSTLAPHTPLTLHDISNMISKRLRRAGVEAAEVIEKSSKESIRTSKSYSRVRRVDHVKIKLEDAEEDNIQADFQGPSDFRTESIKKEEGEPASVKRELGDSNIIHGSEEFSSRPLMSPPKNWLEIYERVKEMRKHVVAPVDTMGCERLPEAMSVTITPEVHRYQLLIALMLSSQTKDEINAIAMTNLRLGLKEKGGLIVDAILNTNEKDIDTMIFKVGFHTRKAGYIKKTTQILKDQYDSDIPKTIPEMMALPGVGPKMAHLLLHRAWGVAEGIGVDVHVHRLANMWGWVKNGKYAPTPERTRASLESWLPREYWVEINPMLVGFGQTICLPRGSKCEECSLANGLCRGVDRKRLKLKGKAIKDIKNENEL
jgi:endonuclease III